MVGRSRLPAYEVIGFLGLFVTGFLAAYTLARHEISSLWPTQPRRQLVRSCLDLANNICVVVALRHVPLTLFYILVFMSPAVITILAAIFLHEHPGLRKSLAIAIGFAGVVIAVNPFGASRQGDWIGYAACHGLRRLLSGQHGLVPRPHPNGNSREPHHLLRNRDGRRRLRLHGLARRTAYAAIASCAFLTGAFCTTGSICFFIALRHTAASNVSQYHYTQLVTGAIVSFLVFHELPTFWMVLGGSLVVASGLYVALLASRGARTTGT